MAQTDPSKQLDRSLRTGLLRTPGPLRIGGPDSSRSGGSSPRVQSLECSAAEPRSRSVLYEFLGDSAVSGPGSLERAAWSPPVFWTKYSSWGGLFRCHAVKKTFLYFNGSNDRFWDQRSGSSLVYTEFVAFLCGCSSSGRMRLQVPRESH